MHRQSRCHRIATKSCTYTIRPHFAHLRVRRPLTTHCKASQTTVGQVSVLEYVPHARDRVEASSDQPPIVLLPGFGNNTADYVAPFGNESAGIVTALQVCRVQHCVAGASCMLYMIDDMQLHTLSLLINVIFPFPHITPHWRHFSIPSKTLYTHLIPTSQPPHTPLTTTSRTCLLPPPTHTPRRVVSRCLCWMSSVQIGLMWHAACSHSSFTAHHALQTRCVW